MKTADGVDPVAPLAPFLEPASPFPGVGQTLSPLLFQEQENDQATHPIRQRALPKMSVPRYPAPTVPESMIVREDFAPQRSLRYC